MQVMTNTFPNRHSMCMNNSQSNTVIQGFVNLKIDRFKCQHFIMIYVVKVYKHIGRYSRKSQSRTKVNPRLSGFYFCPKITFIHISALAFKKDIQAKFEKIIEYSPFMYENVYFLVGLFLSLKARPNLSPGLTLL